MTETLTDQGVLTGEGRMPLGERQCPHPGASPRVEGSAASLQGCSKS
jgi:hypothetical protein